MQLGIYGAGGFARQLIAQHRSQIGFIADDNLFGSEICGLTVSKTLPRSVEAIVAIADPAQRKRIADSLPNPLGRLAAGTALIGEDVEIGEGGVLCEMTQMAGLSSIGRHFHCNIFSYVGHDCTVGDYVTCSPRVSISGNVTIGNGVYLGTGAIMKQGVSIGDGAFIAMGALVSKDIPPGARVVGNRIIQATRYRCT
jgi:sugar O-acyltransferase (sialic acid O-acetyltransferase NeuD family)